MYKIRSEVNRHKGRQTTTGIGFKDDDDDDTATATFDLSRSKVDGSIT